MADAMNNAAPSSTPAASGDWQAAVAYLGILCFYTAWAKGDSPTHMWHAKNGAALFGIYLGIYIVMNILVTILPVGLIGLLGLLMSLVNLALAIASLYGAWNAWKGKQWTIPFVTNLGQKIPLEKWFHKGPAATAPVSTPTAAPTPVAPSTPTEPTPAPTPAPAPMPEPTPAPMPEPAPAPVAPSAPTEPTPPQTPAA